MGNLLLATSNCFGAMYEARGSNVIRVPRPASAHWNVGLKPRSARALDLCK